MINRKRNALTILRPQSRRCGLFLHPKARTLSRVCFFFPAFVYILANFGNKLGHIPPRLFLFPHVCLHFGQFGKQTRAHSPAFVSFPPRLFTFWPILETNSGKSFARSERKCGRDSRFFAAKEVSLSAEGGDSPREQEKSRISVMKDTKKF